MEKNVIEKNLCYFTVGRHLSCKPVTSESRQVLLELARRCCCQLTAAAEGVLAKWSSALSSGVPGRCRIRWLWLTPGRWNRVSRGLALGLNQLRLAVSYRGGLPVSSWSWWVLRQRLGPCSAPTSLLRLGLLQLHALRNMLTAARNSEKERK